jgi:hypothetical protein
MDREASVHSFILSGPQLAVLCYDSGSQAPILVKFIQWQVENFQVATIAHRTSSHYKGSRLHGRIEEVRKVISCGGSGKTHNQTNATVLDKKSGNSRGPPSTFSLWNRASLTVQYSSQTVVLRSL